LCTFWRLAAGAIFRMSACMEFALGTTALIVRFLGIIIGKFVEDFLGRFRGVCVFPGPQRRGTLRRAGWQ